MDNVSDNHNYQSPFDEIDLISPLQLLAKWVDEAKELALPEPVSYTHLRAHET